MMIRILDKSDRAGFYHFCFVTPSERTSHDSTEDASVTEATEVSDGWTDQNGGGNNAYDSSGREIPTGVVLKSTLTALGRQVLWNSGGTA